jgi:AcrR family transcriptional regulator
MREIASVANVPIASVYQYFPDKTALLRALLVEFYERMRNRLEVALTLVRSVDDVPTFTDAMIDGLVIELGAARAHFNVWAAAQSSELLRELDMKDALELADLVTKKFQTIGDGIDPDAVRDISVFAVVMAGPVVRQSFVMPKVEGERLVRELKTLIRLRAAALAEGRSKHPGE